MIEGRGGGVTAANGFAEYAGAVKDFFFFFFVFCMIKKIMRHEIKNILKLLFTIKFYNSAFDKKKIINLLIIIMLRISRIIKI